MQKTPSITVITPTVGSAGLLKCIESVERQSYENYTHLVVVDGRQYENSVISIVKNTNQTATVLTIPENTGASGYFGHRIYGAMPYIVNSDYVAYLDEDNWYDEEHLQSLMEVIVKHDLDWAYSLRKISAADGAHLTYDNCESLGIWGAWCNFQNMIDTSCYLLKRELAIKVSQIWYRKGYSSEVCDPDKEICRWLLKNEIRGFTSGRYSLNYRVGSSESTALLNYFEDGNKVMEGLYREYPWVTSKLSSIDSIKGARRIVSGIENDLSLTSDWLLKSCEIPKA